MRKPGCRPTLGALLVVVLVAPAHAGEVARLGPMEIDTPWARATIGTVRPGAAYVTFRNTGDQLDELVGISTPVAAHSEVHEMTLEGGVMKMGPAGPLEIPPGEEVRLEPAGMHIMLIQLRQPLQEGESVPITFIFWEGRRDHRERPLSKASRPEPHWSDLRQTAHCEAQTRSPKQMRTSYCEAFDR